ncbi:hypothetical protein H5410_021425 [Solanum commersonii]|uniref:Uncharacterized protein n=1 Tax=Solanum commersonii TaxID=4109 RepID=A0A9J5ZE80_SOLCO|nr:hypothetical protein H5410_021425 [Solanum commersonii]
MTKSNQLYNILCKKRVIGLATILNELATNYLNQNTIWSYYAGANNDIFKLREKQGGYGGNKTVGIKPTKTRTKTDDKSYKAKLYLNRANGKCIDNVDIEENCSEQGSDISETYTEILGQIKETDITNSIEVNTEEVENKASTSTSAEVKNPRTMSPNYYTVSYQESDRYDTLWNKRLNKKWTPSTTTRNTNFLDLDCIADINKAIQLWVGYISKQLVDNKIGITEVPGYIERTFIGTVKLWLQNLGEESTKILRNSKKMDGENATTPIDILNKYELAIRNEFSHNNVSRRTT